MSVDITPVKRNHTDNPYVSSVSGSPSSHWEYINKSEISTKPLLSPNNKRQIRHERVIPSEEEVDVVDAVLDEYVIVAFKSILTN